MIIDFHGKKYEYIQSFIKETSSLPLGPTKINDYIQLRTVANQQKPRLSPRSASCTNAQNSIHLYLHRKNTLYPNPQQFNPDFFFSTRRVPRYNLRSFYFSAPPSAGGAASQPQHRTDWPTPPPHVILSPRIPFLNAFALFCMWEGRAVHRLFKPSGDYTGKRDGEKGVWC